MASKLLKIHFIVLGDSHPIFKISIFWALIGYSIFVKKDIKITIIGNESLNDFSRGLIKTKAEIVDSRA